MQLRFLFSIFVFCLIAGSFAKKGFGPGEQDWGYVTVRPGAHMFWWLYYTTARVNSFYQKPLIIWLQGGPGASSTSYGNFEELGPIDVNGNERNHTWVKDYNVIFIDNPVGTGFSYVDSKSALTTTNAQIAADLLECMRGVLKKIPAFANVPTYIMSESYGGKMAAEFALVWYKAQVAGKIKSNLKGVGLGDAWISPIDSVLTWAPFLLHMGVVDTDGYNKINQVAQQTRLAVEKGEWSKATNLWSQTEGVIIRVSDNVDFYNVLAKLPPNSYGFNALQENFSPDVSTAMYKDAVYQRMMESYVIPYRNVDDLMNAAVKPALGLNATHGAQGQAVFGSLWEDFMKPAIHVVEQLLDTTKLRVFVYTGQLDLIVDTPGTVDWVEGMKWRGSSYWMMAKRRSLVVNNVIEGYVKFYGRFGMYWVNRAGHMVPADNPPAMARILTDMTSGANTLN